MGGDLNGSNRLDLWVGVFSSNGCIGNSDHERRNAEMSAAVGTIVVMASVGILFIPWLAEVIADIRNR